LPKAKRFIARSKAVFQRQAKFSLPVLNSQYATGCSRMAAGHSTKSSNLFAVQNTFLGFKSARRMKNKPY
jgi:hypothetical protein